MTHIFFSYMEKALLIITVVFSMSASHLGEGRALFNLMTTCTILPNGLDWTVSTLVYSTFYAFHCDDVKHRESLQSCYGI